MDAITLTQDQFRELLVSLSTSASASASESMTKLKLKEPETFHGDRDKLQGFLSQLTLQFKADKAKFKNDKAKIIYAASYLRDLPSK